MDKRQMYQKILDGKAVLIAGSGINMGVKGCDGKNLLTGCELAEKMYMECGITDPDDKYDLQDAAQTYLETKTDLQLVTLLKRLLSVSKISSYVKAIYQLPWMRYYTTNYDDVPVLSTSGVKSITPVTISEETEKYLDKTDICVYINGYIGTLNERTLNTEFKLTTKSYLAEQNLFNSQWGAVLKDDLELAEVIIIAGLSLEYDLELKKIIYNSNIIMVS